MLFSLSMFVKGYLRVADVMGKGHCWAGVRGHMSVPGTMPAAARAASISATSTPSAAHMMAVAITVELPVLSSSSSPPCAQHTEQQLASSEQASHQGSKGTHVSADQGLVSWCQPDGADDLGELCLEVLQEDGQVGPELFQGDGGAGNAGFDLEHNLHGDAVPGDGCQVLLVPLELVDVVHIALLVGLGLEAGQGVDVLEVVLRVKVAGIAVIIITAALSGVLLVLVVVLVVLS
ncbi:hypothetical protein COO60DRAFT_17442 [Scenedesmus sp. NREL 46B-D3]|nr:hypothetical protein COO60DRAFT_17442 [Scenedesmus sp. NREL 46B-D3]